MNKVKKKRSKESQQIRKLFNLILKEKARRSEVIVWLQGDRYDRGQKVFEFFRNNFASKILISGNNILIGKGPRKGEENISLGEMKKWLIKKGVRAHKIIINEGPLNTPQQAKNIISLAILKNWKSIILVGSSYYQPRAFLTFLKIAKDKNWQGRIINQSVILSDNQIPGGREKTVADLWQEEIRKIRKYKNNLATIEDGIAYLSDKK